MTSKKRRGSQDMLIWSVIEYYHHEVPTVLLGGHALV